MRARILSQDKKSYNMDQERKVEKGKRKNLND